MLPFESSNAGVEVSSGDSMLCTRNLGARCSLLPIDDSGTNSIPPGGAFREISRVWHRRHLYLESSCSIPIDVNVSESRTETADGLFNNRRRAGLMDSESETRKKQATA